MNRDDTATKYNILPSLILELFTRLFLCIDNDHLMVSLRLCKSHEFSNTLDPTYVALSREENKLFLLITLMGDNVQKRARLALSVELICTTFNLYTYKVWSNVYLI